MPHSTEENNLAICAIVKNEELYIQEWIEFHSRQGVSKFYIFDNNSTDYTLTILRKLEGRLNGIYIFPNWAGLQAQAYKYYINLFSPDSKWAAFIDVDEFLFSPQGKQLPEVLKDYDDECGVVAHWVLYGSSGRKSYSSGPVRDRFLSRARNVNPHYKSIVKLSEVSGVGPNPHSFTYYGRCAVNENRSLLISNPGLDEEATADILRINHYAVKSEEECRVKCARGRADTGGTRDFEEFFNAHDVNEIVDPILVER